MKDFYVRNETFPNDGVVKAENKEEAVVRWSKRRGESISSNIHRYDERSILVSEIDDREVVKNMVGKCYKGKCSFYSYIKILERLEDKFKIIRINLCKKYLGVELRYETIMSLYDVSIFPTDKTDDFTGMEEIDNKEFSKVLNEKIIDFKKGVI